MSSFLTADVHSPEPPEEGTGPTNSSSQPTDGVDTGPATPAPPHNETTSPSATPADEEMATELTNQTSSQTGSPTGPSGHPVSNTTTAGEETLPTGVGEGTPDESGGGATEATEDVPSLGDGGEEGNGSGETEDAMPPTPAPTPTTSESTSATEDNPEKQEIDETHPSTTDPLPEGNTTVSNESTTTNLTAPTPSTPGFRTNDSATAGIAPPSETPTPHSETPDKLQDAIVVLQGQYYYSS